MELIETRALKSSFLSAMKSSNLDDIWCVTGINNVLPTDDFCVDDLFDFSDKDFSHEDNDENTAAVSQLSTVEDVSSLPAADLPFPADELESLEWLSQFVDDTASEFSMLFPAKDKPIVFPEPRSEPVVRPKKKVPCFPLPVPVKARTKRSRPAGGTWTVASPTVSADSSPPSASSSYGSSHFLLAMNPIFEAELFWSVEKPQKKAKKSSSSEETGSSRCCTHCLVQKTPQWRTGPLGPKTLCNACGVRFKSGRLFPEYRPACSPTFSQEIHSNSHRKVLEMRRKKETVETINSGLNSMVSSC